MHNDKPIFIKDDEYGFWKQQNPKPFKYDLKYKKKQSTTENMCWLRLGLLSSCIPPLIFKDLNVCDVGSGNGIFVKKFSHLFNEMCGYDLTGDSISYDYLCSKIWDVIFLTDVLEHFNDIEDLFNIKWRFLFLSYPETPEVCTNQEILEQWKHYKPDEHIWCLNTPGMVKWFLDHDCTIQTVGDLEDLIRRPTQSHVNITTMIVKNDKYI